MTKARNITPLPVVEKAGEVRANEEKAFYPCLTTDEILKTISHNFAGVPVSIEKYGKGVHMVIILPEAMAEFDAMVGWGRRTPNNAYEQLYQGIGHVFVDKSESVTLVISHFLYIYAADRSPVSACVFKGSYDSIMERIAYEREVYNRNEIKYNRAPQGYSYDPFVVKCGKSIPVLYGHTHPNIGVFFSPDDRTSGFASASLPAATFVADPIRKEMKAMIGIGQEDARILALRYSTAVNRTTERKKEDNRVRPSGMTVRDAYESILKCCNAINTSGERAVCKVSERKGFGGSLQIRANMRWVPGNETSQTRK